MRCVISSITILVGLVVLVVGWQMGFEQLTNVCCDYVSMKGATAIAFILSGLIGFCVIDKGKHQFELALITLALTLQVAGMMISQVSAFDYATNFIAVSDESKYTIEAHLPSLGTMAGFSLISLIALGHLLHKKSYYAPVAVSGIGVVSLLGYVLCEPWLYFYIPGVSTGMALHTAICFILMGIVFCTKKEETQRSGMSAPNGH